MFDDWQADPEYPSLYHMDRDVVVDVARVFPASGIRKDEIPLWVKSCGLLLEPVCHQRERPLPAHDAAVATVPGTNRGTGRPGPNIRGIAQGWNTCTPPTHCQHTIYTPPLGDSCTLQSLDGR